MASHVAVSSSFMYPANVASPESTTGAAKNPYTAHPAATAHQSMRRSRIGSDSAKPATASTSTAGSASSAVASEAVAM